jgi:hypothetical protein
MKMRNFRTGVAIAALLVAAPAGIVIAALLVATPATDPQPSTGPLSIAELIEPKKVKTVSVRPDGTLLPNDAPYPLQVPQTGPYGAPAVTRDVGPSPTGFFLTDTESKQHGLPQSLRTGTPAAAQRIFPPISADDAYTAGLHVGYDFHLRQYDYFVAQAKDAVAHGRDPARFLMGARTAKWNCERINRLLLESQKP